MSTTRSTASRSIVAILAVLLLVAALPATVLAATVNDERADTILVGTLPFVDVQDTSDATTAADDPDCFGNGPTVWYGYEATASLDLAANTFGSDYDTTLSVYVEEGGGLEQIACNDDWGSLQSQVFFTTEPGVTYLLMVGSFASQFPGGNLVFNMDEGTAPPPPEPIDVSIDFISASVHRSSGHVTLEGTISCSSPAIGYLAVELRQRVGRGYITGWAENWVECGPVPAPLTVTTWYESGVFAGGSIQLNGWVEVSTGEEYGSAIISDQVRAQMVR